jgi:lipid A 3-O-deacylase
MASGRWLRRLIAAALMAWAACCGPARAEDDPSFVSLSAGGYDIIGVHSHPAGFAGGEFRFGTKLWIFKPMLGVIGTSSGSFYGYGGFLVDIYLSPRWVLTPNGAFGYFSQGSGTDLGSHSEFRTGAELAYRFDDRSRLGLQFHHISNAGISKKNPGEEDAGIVYSIPFDLFK